MKLQVQRRSYIDKEKKKVSWMVGQRLALDGEIRVSSLSLSVETREFSRQPLSISELCYLPLSLFYCLSISIDLAQSSS